MSAALSTAYWAFVAALCIAMFPGALVLWCLSVVDRRRVLLHQYTCFWASLFTWCSPVWSVRVRGRERIRRGRTYVMVANHRSSVDILVLFRLFRHFKWVSKAEVFKVPVIGWNMALNGYIGLRRGDRESVTKMLAACRRTLQDGSSIMIFPEGTRATTAEFLPFKPGAFELAIASGCAVLPISIEGSANALPKRGFQVRHSDIVVTVLEEVSVAGLTIDDAPRLAEQVRARIAAAQAGARRTSVAVGA